MSDQGTPTGQGEAEGEGAPPPAPSVLSASGLPLPPPTWPPPAPEGPEPSRRGRSIGLVAGAIVLVVAVVAAVLVVTLGGSQQATLPPSPSPTATEEPVLLAPTGVTSSIDGFDVTIAWSEPAGGRPVDSFVVRRNDTSLASLPSTTVSYTDHGAQPGTSYTYSVQAIAAGVPSTAVTAQVEIPVPPLAQARLAGTFNVKSKVVSSSGFISIKPTGGYGFKFAPVCASGPCNVTWTMVALKGIKAVLTRSGASYTGAETANFHVQCGSTDLQTTWTLTFHVTKAKALDGVWRASAIAGTIDESTASQLGCVSSRATESFTGALYAP